MGLVLKEKICLRTPQGMSEVQLMFGDITQLPVKEKVDYIFTSAFPGDYTEVPGTLIGALKRNLGLKVSQLAMDKMADLRRSFNCWVSKELPEEMPYRRLVCFERMNRFETLQEQISGMFRAMMPVFNNEDTTVITPLLAAGNQGHSELLVLKSIVMAACHWIRAGLPLRCLKIVMYLRDAHKISDNETKMLQCFSELKKKWETQKDVEVDKTEKTYDVCLSFSAKDDGLAQEICKELTKVDVKIRVYSQHFTYNHEEVWQDTIFQIMIHSRKIVAVLTPNYISDAECLEQFSLALCCNRLTKDEALAPFYMQSVEVLPSYMTLVQYTECRVCKEGEVAEQKIFMACSLLVKSLDRESQQHTEPTSKDSKEPREDKRKYDIFISYAHRTPVEAQRLYEALLDVNPGLKIFLDKSELRTGNIWQEALYEAVDKARCVIAFITESYLHSTVCQEEYNIALARFMSSNGVYFIPLLTDANLTEIPVEFSEAPVVDMRDTTGRFMEMYHTLAELILKWMEKVDQNKFTHPPKQVRIASVTETWRQHDFNKRFEFNSNDSTITLKNNSQTSGNDRKRGKPSKTIVFSFAKDCFHYAAALAKLLGSQDHVDVKCEFLMPQKETLNVQPPKLQLLDSADMVVILMSDEYMMSIEHRHELHITLCRQRTTKDRPVVYLIQANHVVSYPTYPHLLNHSISLGDKLWETLANKLPREQDPILANMPWGETMTVHCSRGEKQALTAATLDIVAKLTTEPSPGGSGMPTNIVNLEHLIRQGAEKKIPVQQCLVPFSVLKNQKAVQAPKQDTSASATETAAITSDSPPDSKAQLQGLRGSSPAGKSGQKSDTKSRPQSTKQKNSSSCDLL